MGISKALFVLIFSLLVAYSHAYTFYVGGREGWVLHPSESYSDWSSRNRFQINDTLVFKYKKGEDSVLEVSQQDYDQCNLNNPLQRMDTGDSVFKLDRSGPFFFVSGTGDRCKQGEKLSVVVLAVRHRGPLQPVPPTVSPSLAPTLSPVPNSSPVGPPMISPASTPAVSPVPNSPSVGPPMISPASTPAVSPAPMISPASTPAVSPVPTPTGSLAPSPHSVAPPQNSPVSPPTVSSGPSPSPSIAMPPATPPTLSPPSVSPGSSPAPSPFTVTPPSVSPASSSPSVQPSASPAPGTSPASSPFSAKPPAQAPNNQTGSASVFSNFRVSSVACALVVVILNYGFFN